MTLGQAVLKGRSFSCAVAFPLFLLSSRAEATRLRSPQPSDLRFAPMPQNPFFESISIVTGPLLISSTCIIS